MKGLMLIFQSIMINNMKTKEAENFYSKRKIEPETVFGNIKHNKGFRYFLLRGLEKVKAEFFIISSVHNMGKIIKHLKTNPLDIEKTKVYC